MLASCGETHLCVIPLRLMLGVWSQHDGAQVDLISPPRQPLPELLRHEGHERMQKPAHRNRENLVF